MANGRLLIIDDEPAVGQVIRSIAETMGFEARYTADPDTFFHTMEEWRPTHVAVDLVMPDMDGVEVMVRLAEHRCGARIIITSGVGSRVLDAAGRSAGEHGLDFAGVLSKPFSPGALRTLLAEEPAPGEAPCAAASREAPPADSEVTASELERALARREFHLVYQPKVDCASGALAGVEALARWTHPRRGLVMPDRFIPVAEARDLIGPLTEQVLDEAIEWFSRHCLRADDSGCAEVALAVNVSAKTLRDGKFVDRIVARCRERQVDPARLTFELTETSAMEDPTTSLDLLTRLRMKGFHLSIDDFGTGYSSMLQLVRLPFSEIKVDKSFVITAGRSEESRAVIKCIVDLGHSLGLRAAAEGVEDAETLDYLRGIGCDLAQGYLIARPMAGDDLLRWIARSKTRHTA